MAVPREFDEIERAPEFVGEPHGKVDLEAAENAVFFHDDGGIVRRHPDPQGRLEGLENSFAACREKTDRNKHEAYAQRRTMFHNQLLCRKTANEYRSTAPGVEPNMLSIESREGLRAACPVV